VTAPYQKGDLVAGRYRIEKELGAGGMGALFIAVQTGFERRVALKVLPATVPDKNARDRFILEAKAVCDVKHPNIVTYYDFGTDPDTGRMFLVMELLDGRSLHDVLKQDAPLPASRVLHIISQLCEALVEAHKNGIIHRDLKPANIMLVRRGEDRDFVKLIDFGIARMTRKAKGITSAGMIIGTVGYLAPEYIQTQVVNERTDVYALGIICYELIAGRRPFVAKKQIDVMRMHVQSPVPPLSEHCEGRDWSNLGPLSDRIERALDKDPKTRTPTVRAFKTHLMAAAAALLDEDHAASTTLQPGADLISMVDPETTVQEPGLKTTGRGVIQPTGTQPQPSVSQLTAPPPTSPLKWVAAGVFVTVLVAAATVGIVKWVGSEPETPTTTSESAKPVVAEREPEPEPEVVPPPTVAAAAPEIERRKSGREERRELQRRGLETPPPIEKPARVENPAQVVKPATIEKPVTARYPVTILARPRGKVYLGSKKLGQSPPIVSASVAAGKRCFTAIHPTTKARKRKCIRVGPGRNHVLIDLSVK